MEKILNMNEELDIVLFEEIVSNAFNPSSPLKKEAEDVLLRFKENPNSWTKVDIILKSARKMHSKFIALQILEANVKVKWSLFNEDIKKGLRQYVYSAIIERSQSSPDIIIQKLNSVLTEIIVRDWPRKWPTFINDLINTSQTTSMSVCSNSLVILRDINERIFLMQEDMTTARKRLLRNSLKQEYPLIFSFINLILEYSETQELDFLLLDNCLKAFKSFCKSMPPEYVFSTKIVDLILVHLNSPHSSSTLDCLLEVIELGKDKNSDSLLSLNESIVQSQKAKVEAIHSELLNFFKMYLNKFNNQDDSEKLALAYKRMEEDEKFFLKKYARLFSSLYMYWIDELNKDNLLQGLKFLIQLSKIEEPSLFREIFPTWAALVNKLYSEYPIRIPTSRPLKRNFYTPILNQLLPVLISNMPRPEEVFILENELGEIVKDKMIETAEIEFYKEMKYCLFNLSFCIEEYMKTFFEQKISKHSNNSYYDHAIINRLCWSIGSIAGALEESAERTFFVAIIKILLTICEIRSKKEEKAVIASNIMFIIGQYHRFLKYNYEFMFVVVMKLFEFMEETYEGIKEMACDNFLKICEKCPNQFFLKKDQKLIIDIVIRELNTIQAHLDYYLQRIVLEGLLIIIKNGPKKDVTYIDLIFKSLTSDQILSDSYLSNLPIKLSEPDELKKAVNFVESYSLGFKILPEIFHNVSIMNSFLILYKKITELNALENTVLKKNFQFIKNSLASFFKTVVESSYEKEDFLNLICEGVLMDFRQSFEPSLLSLASAVIYSPKVVGAIEIQRLQFMIANLIVPSIPNVANADEHPQLGVEYFKLLISMAEKTFDVSFPLLMDSPSFEPLVKSILFSLSSIREVSSLSLDALQIFYKKCFDQKLFNFFNKFYFITLENILGIIFDKDCKHSFEKQSEILFELLSYLPSLPTLDPSSSNTQIIKDFIYKLFTDNFPNITPSSLKLFVEGIFEIKILPLFTLHISDFNVKIYEYCDDESIEDEIEILRERVAKSNV